MTRSFTIATTGRVPPRRWWWVRVYDTPDQLRAAAHRSVPGYGRAHWSDTLGCCQPVPQRIRIHRDGTEQPVEPANGYAGTIRLAATHLTPEVLAHETLHAAAAVYRMNVHHAVSLGNGCRRNEERLAYIHGELFAALHAALEES